ncbi:hypothetical protein NL676_033311 [Syzygium grande]|nr:hypothetical protein NL676_033311 [Syzygium grande]
MFREKRREGRIQKQEKKKNFAKLKKPPPHLTHRAKGALFMGGVGPNSRMQKVVGVPTLSPCYYVTDARVGTTRETSEDKKCVRDDAKFELSRTVTAQFESRGCWEFSTLRLVGTLSYVICAVKSFLLTLRRFADLANLMR